jgi:CRP/FNR family transcriptional regulator, cyclic AMP receptor protein
MSTARAVLEASELFGSMPSDVLEDLGRLMSRASFPAGETVFQQGEPGDRMIVLDAGRLETQLAVPGREPLRLSSVEPGQVVGELSLLGGGVRTATVHATETSTGWALERTAFDVLRNDAHRAASVVARALGLLAVERLNRLYRRWADQVTGEPTPAEVQNGEGAVPAEPHDEAFLAGTLFFEDFNPNEFRAVTAELRCVEVARGTVVVPCGERPSTLWIVARGAVATSIRGSETARPLRLAGPGRAIGHIGLLEESPLVERIESRARERAVLLVVPWPRVWELLKAEDRASRRFAAALWTDTVRALQHGERPLARLSATSRGPATPVPQRRARQAEADTATGLRERWRRT